MLDKIKNKHILIDGDIVKYRCAACAEKTKYLVEDNGVFSHWDSHKDATFRANIPENSGIIWSRKEVQPLEFALQACKTTLDALSVRLEPRKVSIFLSPARTFRDEIAVTRPYKGNRVQQKPRYLKDCEEYLIREHGAIVGDNVEADDEIGRALSNDRDGGVSVSIDKDLLQISGWHYNWVNDRVQWISPRQGDVYFYTQMLTGDVTDNIPGLPGYGPAAAKKVLNGVQSRADAASRVWGHYRNLFDDPNKAREYFLEQAALLWILRENEYSERTGGYNCPIPLT